MTSPAKDYPEDSVGRRMTANVPVCRPRDTFGTLIQELFDRPWDAVSHIYVLGSHRKLQGYIDLAVLTNADPSATAERLMLPIKGTLHPDADQEQVIFTSVTHDVDRVPVVDAEGAFLGVITAKSLIDIMHEEHLEDLLLSAGLRGKGSRLIQVTAAESWQVIKVRTPWLTIGLLVGLGLGFITKSFELTLEKSLALAFFIPVVTFIADSVGTQSEAITVRALAVTHLRYSMYLLKELLVGSIIGTFTGLMGGLGALFISHSPQIAMVVGLSLTVASMIAAVLGSAIPIVFKATGQDPALGSGPIATAVQDVISILIYFIFATWIIT